MSNYELEVKKLMAAEILNMTEFDNVEEVFEEEDLEMYLDFALEDVQRYVLKLWEADGPAFRVYESEYKTCATLGDVAVLLNIQDQEPGYHGYEIFDLENLFAQDGFLNRFTAKIKVIELVLD